MGKMVGNEFRVIPDSINDTLISGLNILQHPREVGACFGHQSKILYDLDVPYARRLLRKAAAGDTCGITFGVFFAALFLVQNDLASSPQLRENFLQALEKTPFFCQKVLPWIFHDQPVPDMAWSYFKKGITRLREEFVRKETDFAYNFFTLYPRSLSFLSPSALHIFIARHDVAQLIFANPLLFDKFLRSPLTQEEQTNGFDEGNKIAKRLVKLVAGIPELQYETMGKLNLELLLGGEEGNYAVSLFNRIFDDPTYSQAFLSTKLLEQAALSSNSSDSLVRQSVAKLRQYFYGNCADSRLVALLKKKPQAFLQLAGEHGEHLVDLLQLSYDPLELMKYFVADAKTMSNEVVSVVTDAVLAIALRFVQKFPKHVDKLLDLKVGQQRFVTCLENAMRRCDDAMLRALLANDYLCSKLKLEVTEYISFVRRSSWRVELAAVNNEFLWEKFQRTFPENLAAQGVFFAARIEAEKNLKKIGENPSTIGIFESLMIASNKHLWNKVCPRQNWWQRWFGDKKQFASRMEKFRRNQVFDVRLNYTVEQGDLSNLLMSTAMLELQRVISQWSDNDRTVYAGRINDLVQQMLLFKRALKFAQQPPVAEASASVSGSAAETDAAFLLRVASDENLRRKIHPGLWLDIVLHGGTTGAKIIQDAPLDFNRWLLNELQRLNIRAEETMQFKSKLGAQVLNQLLACEMSSVELYDECVLLLVN